MNRFVKRLLLVFLSVTFLLCGFSCSGSDEGGYIFSEGVKLYPQSVISVDGIAVPFDEYRYVYLYARNSNDGGDLTYWDGEETETKIADLKDYVYNYCVETYVMLSMAKDLSLSITDDDILEADAYLDSTRTSYETDKEYLSDLKASFLTEELYRRLLLNNTLSQKLYDYYYGESGTKTMSDEEFISFYQDTYYAAKHILIRFRGEESFEDYDETYAAVSEVYEKLKAGADFDELVAEYSEDSDMAANFPSGYHFTDGEMLTGFGETVKTLEIGEYSEPVMTTLGYHIILRCEIDPQVRDEMKSDILSGYYDDYGNWCGGYYETSFYNIIKQRINDGNVKVEVTPEYDLINPYTLF